MFDLERTIKEPITEVRSTTHIYLNTFLIKRERDSMERTSDLPNSLHAYLYKEPCFLTAVSSPTKTTLISLKAIVTNPTPDNTTLYTCSTMAIIIKH